MSWQTAHPRVAGAVVRLHRVRFVELAPDGSHREHRFDTDEITIGSGSSNDLVLADAAVSRHHCAVSRDDAGHLLRDLDSTNGSFLNGARIREAYLHDGALVRVGDTVLRAVAESEEIRVEPSPAGRLGDAVGAHPSMREVFAVAERLARSSCTVLLLGESGTGKEVMARAIHDRSPRAGKPFVVLDCGAVSAGLLESELFGHERGSFTGAMSMRPGLFETAGGGTVLLDEIGELPLDLQAKLLRVVERRELRRVGANVPRRVAARIMAATHRDLAEEVAAKRFRADLFHRLAVATITLPPLRDRPSDIEPLCQHLLATLAENRLPGGARRVRAVTAEALAILGQRQWPGNVRELRNVIERAVVFADGPELRPEHVEVGSKQRTASRSIVVVNSSRDIAVSGAPAGDGPSPSSASWSDRAVAEAIAASGPVFAVKEQLVATLERELIRALLRRHDGNVTRAAHGGGLDRRYFQRLMTKYGLERVEPGAQRMPSAPTASEEAREDGEDREEAAK